MTIPVKFDPSIAGNGPVKFAAVKLVIFDPSPTNPLAVAIPVTSRLFNTLLRLGSR